MAEPQHPIPDFHMIAREVEKCAQLPAFEQSTAILNSLAQINRSLQDLTRQMNVMQTQFDRRLDGMDQRLDGMDQRIASQNRNSIARLQNAKKNHLSDVLAPLHDHRNQPIDGFPETIAGIERLRGVDLDTIFAALGIGTNGNVPEKKTSLRMALGLQMV